MHFALAGTALGTLCTTLLLAAHLPGTSAAARAGPRPRNRLGARYLSPSPRTELEPFLTNPKAQPSADTGGSAGLVTATSSGLPCDPQLAILDSFARQELLDPSARRAGDVVELDWSAVASSDSAADAQYTLRKRLRASVLSRHIGPR